MSHTHIHTYTHIYTHAQPHAHMHTHRAELNLFMSLQRDFQGCQGKLGGLGHQVEVGPL